MHTKSIWLCLVALAMPGELTAGDAAVHGNLEVIRAVGPKGRGNKEASQAWANVVASPNAKLPDILSAMKDANPLARNWLRSAAEAVADVHMAKADGLEKGALESFLLDRNNDPHARRLAYELLLRSDESARDRLIPKMLDDPSLELRRDAVEMKLTEARAADGDSAIAMYKMALSAARDKDQVDAAAKAIRKAGGTVNLPRHFGFLTRWQIVGPFDNEGKQGYAVAYPPEESVDLTASYKGKAEQVNWDEYASDDEYGIVDLTKALDKHKGAIAYAYTKFACRDAENVQLRLGCINANKVWVNGKQVIANEVYHAGMYVDQYSADVTFNKGWNEILIKVAQNEQEESWAQRWQFQLRVCDPTGTAILSMDRDDDDS